MQSNVTDTPYILGHYQSVPQRRESRDTGRGVGLYGPTFMATPVSDDQD